MPVGGNNEYRTLQTKIRPYLGTNKNFLRIKIIFFIKKTSFYAYPKKGLFSCETPDIFPKISSK